ncbi:MAG: phenylphosphate carboxylase subunit delta [Burkholderiaceae bacterium]|jgi:3-deoxy-D-manno-octulosonate 8-phosphate phosphatase (KDO 8-P phosphatase)
MLASEERAPTLLQRLAPLEVMIFDVDGVLTDGSLHYGGDGETTKVFHVLDGQGLIWLKQVGITVAIISGRKSKAVQRRAADLGIERVMEGVEDKRVALDTLLRQVRKSPRETGFMGDDVMDIPVMRRVGFAATVPHAANTVAAHAHWMSSRAGGHGAAREVAELILSAQGKLEGLMARFLE